ncbi:MAG TPA: hypothetical protein VFZ87_12290 [Gemmatimonadales bacterium]
MLRARLTCPLLLLLLGCAGPQPGHTPAPSQLAAAESLYADLRDIRDQIDVALAAGHNGITDVTPVGFWIHSHNQLRAALAARLPAIDSTTLGTADRRALRVMRATVERDIGVLTPSTAPTGEPRATAPGCTYDPQAVLQLPKGLDSLRSRIYACYGWAQSHVVAGRDTVDRLTILGRLGRTADPARRRQLFLALDPVWRSVNRANQRTSPYRVLVAEEVRKQNGRPPSLAQAAASGLPADSLELWLVAMLETWRQSGPDSLIEPWDWYYRVGEASRRLSPAISRERLLQLNTDVYRSLGADVESLGVYYDVYPREGKTPVAYTTFAARPRRINGSWRPGKPWVVATYRTGGLDNLNELLHETGHAAHIAAIRTRPAFADWPDSDPFTEAVADFIALDVYEPAWQQHWLGDSVPEEQGLRARYAGIIMDVAWALFELRMQRQPAADPNQVWTALTRDYLRIRPHPELSWWAMRGQLVDAPGYMMNYAAGAMVIAAIRERTRKLHGPFSTGDSTWYGWIAPRLFRFGLERPSRQVVEEFLGGPVSPAAILSDMGRMAPE